MRVGELGVVAERGAVLPALDDRAQLVAEPDPEVEGGADALRRQRQAVARGVADEEDPPSVALRILCGIQLPW